jgi:hypothetical protein
MRRITRGSGGEGGCALEIALPGQSASLDKKGLLVSDQIRASCGQCGAKYRLPVEAAGRSARCKKCGGTFEVPQAKSLEDSVLDWLTEPEVEEEVVADRPRVINMQKDEGDAGANQARGPIRLKSGG